MRTIKKYSNRRLYDTQRSGYITLEELAEIIRGGDDVTVVDAKTNEDLTQVTLAQIIIDGRGAARLLSVDLLTQMVRMDDYALGEFLSKYMTWALEMYTMAKRGAQAVSPYVPFATAPFSMTNAMARMFGGFPFSADRPTPTAPDSAREDIDALRREVDELKQALKSK